MTFLIPTMKKVRSIRKEYDEPFPEVVKGMAKLGYSKLATMQTLEFHSQLFRKLLTHYDLHGHFDKRNYNEDCKAKPWGNKNAVR